MKALEAPFFRYLLTANPRTAMSTLLQSLATPAARVTLARAGSQYMKGGTSFITTTVSPVPDV